LVPPWRAVTVAVETTPWRSSVTTPDIAPDVACALACKNAPAINASERANSLIVLVINTLQEEFSVQIFLLLEPVLLEIRSFRLPSRGFIKHRNQTYIFGSDSFWPYSK